MVHNEDITKNIAQIQISVDVMSIFLDFILRDFHFYITKKNELRPPGIQL